MKTQKKRAFRTLLVATFIVGTILLGTTWASRKTSWRFATKEGPWGHLECVHIAVEMPEPFISLEEIDGLHARWRLGGYTKAQAEAFFKSLKLPQDQFESLTQKAKWEVEDGGVWISPDDKLILSLPAEARGQIYSLLAKFSENLNQQNPFAYRSEILPGILERSHLQESTIQAFKKLLYRNGNLMFFAHADILVNSLSDHDEKIRLLKTISRTSTLLVKLKIDPTANLDELADYWSYGRWKKDIRVLLESMMAVPEGCKIDVAHVLPAFLRQRIYTYPNPTDPSVTNRNCHWTSMNFLNEVPDDRFSDPIYVQQVLATEFKPVQGTPRLGDVVFFIDERGDVLHSATFIADNIVFTKNGGAANRPWVYMEMEDLLASYNKVGEKMNMIVCRRVSL